MNVLHEATQMKVIALVGSLMESFLEATYTVVFIASVVYQRRHHKKINWTMHITSALLYTMATIHWLVGIVQLKEAFVDNGTSVFGPALYFSVSSNPLHLLRVVLYFTCTILIDLLLAYRLFVLFERNPWIVIPTLVCLSAFIPCFIIVVIRYAHAKWYAEVLPDGPVGPYVISAYTLSIVTIFYPSALIVYQIVKKHMNGSQNSSTRSIFWPVVHTVIESALFYFILNCVMLGLYLKQSSYIYLFLNINPQLVGINFSLILLRISALSARRRRRISLTVPSQRTSHLSFSVRSQDIKSGASENVALQSFGSEQHPSAPSGHESKTLSPLATSRDTLRPEAAYGTQKSVSRSNSGCFSDSAQLSIASSPTCSDTLFSASPTKTTFTVSSPKEAHTPPIDPR